MSGQRLMLTTNLHYLGPINYGLAISLWCLSHIHPSSCREYGCSQVGQVIIRFESDFLGILLQAPG